LARLIVAKLKLTKNELKREKERLKRFKKYLPMLQLKKQQLQLEIIKNHQNLNKISEEVESFLNSLQSWIELFGEDVEIERLFKVDRVVVERGNIAGIDIPVFKDIKFKEAPYDLYLTPLWVDRGIEALRELLGLKAERAVLERAGELLKEELRITTQRVNLFEKVKIPEAIGNIKKINIFLGDLATSEVVRGKIAKSKLN
jgi:V/A-type H+/Na+-transporting ATPase subunit D